MIPALTTYWLYHDGKPVGAVRLPLGASDSDVRYAAVTWHQRVPICQPDYAPFEFTRILLGAEVRL